MALRGDALAYDQRRPEMSDFDCAIQADDSGVNYCPISSLELCHHFGEDDNHVNGLQISAERDDVAAALLESTLGIPAQNQLTDISYRKRRLIRFPSKAGCSCISSGSCCQ